MTIASIPTGPIESDPIEAYTGLGNLLTRARSAK